jgi:hypothetical protein
VGHKGTIYKYSAPNKEITDFDIKVAIKHYEKLKYLPEKAEDFAYKILSKKSRIFCKYS